MNRWWWLVLIVQVASCKVLAQGESTTAQGESDCQDPDCKSGPLFSQQPGIDEPNVVKRQPLLSRWGSQRLSDLFYFDYKRRPAFSSWGGKRGPAFSSWGGKRSVRNTHANDSHAWTQNSLPDEFVTTPYHTLETSEKLEPTNDEWNNIEARKLHLYSFPEKNPLVPFSSSRGSMGKSLFNSGVPRKESYLEYMPFKENIHEPLSDTINEMDHIYKQGDTLGNCDGERAADLDSRGGKRNAAFNSWGGKRAAAFNSWGGKRALGLNDLDEEKRTAAFNSWGGKRAAAFNSWGGKRVPEFYNFNEDKRAAAFNSWGGKRAPELYDLDEEKRAAAFNSWGGKRAAAFNSWGGKRTPELYDSNEDKRAAAFNSWGGKRNAAFNSWGGKRAAAFNSWGGKRNAAFNSWGGKRAPELYDSNENKRAAAFNSWGGKRNAAFNSWGGKRAAAFNSWGGKRAAAFNSWGGKRALGLNDLDEEKRTAAFNSWGGKRAPELYDLDEDKRAAAFNSWGGKRNAAFNSWGGKRAAAFNSWGGKRAPELYDLDEDKRAAAFNSWGGKRNAAFNSWGGKRSPELYSSGDDKRVPAFNSWGGKRTNTAFSSWGGKRAAAFNSWGGKRTPAFNSWGGKRNELVGEKDLESQNLDNTDKGSKNYGNFTHQNALEFDASEQTTILPQESNPLETILSSYNVGDRGNDNDDCDSKNDSSIRQKRIRMTIRAGKRKPRFYSWGGKKRSGSETDEYDDNYSPDEDYLFEPLDHIEDENAIEDDNAVMDDKSIKKRIDELYTTHSRSGFSGKRKPAFSSWGGKRSEPDGKDDEDKTVNNSRRKKRSIMDEENYGVWGENSNDLIDNSLIPTNTVTCCVKKLQYGDRNLFMQMLFRTNGFRDISWPSIRPNRRGADFYAWGGKRTAL